MDIFLDEDVAYAKRLIDAGVSVEAHIWNGALHGFDYIAPRTALARAAWDKRIAFVRSHL
jgi:acetyl esterase/lipase